MWETASKPEISRKWKYGSTIIDSDKLLNSEEKHISAGLQSLHKWRKTDMMLD